VAAFERRPAFDRVELCGGVLLQFPLPPDIFWIQLSCVHTFFTSDPDLGVKITGYTFFLLIILIEYIAF
jgi:hypothetical protein